MTDLSTSGPRYVVAVVVATEVPPHADTPEAEFRGVIDVIRNRARIKNKSEALIVLERNQFSAVCREEYWRKAMAGEWFPSHVARCYELLGEQWADTTDGATHYYSPISMVPQWSAPNWAAQYEEKPVEGVRPTHFRFYKGAL